jgi:hypothetical protein
MAKQEQEQEQEQENTIAPNGSDRSGQNSSDVNGEIFFDWEKKTFVGITKTDLEVWVGAYPAVNIELQIKKAAAWQSANPKKRKKNYERFLVNWLGKCQERGGDIPSNKPGENQREWF